MSIGITIVVAVVTFLVGGALSYIFFKHGLRTKYDNILKEAENEAEVIKKNKLLEVKEKFLNKKADLEKEVAIRNQKIQQAENKLKQREMVLNQKNEELQRKRNETDAIKENLIPPELSARQISLVYANEADVLNMALFGMTAKEWRDAHPELKGNIRDYANVSQLVCLSNLENLNAVFINEGIPQAERLAKLNAIAISQMKVLTEDHRLLQLEEHKQET